ncbi:hypothetical protein B0T26DRAFT_710879 [Lasiosphaeria miniovina]|uniref:Uncharacterized protein n=1 Tax=Lasiosphaeria miniovina TaxID=1954250 RepID=A0AA40DVE9_9PEZI|nr:uncharacterized protein B0T26DRAFT_710879 [Lasiosphaeria miniovina]KAK0717799.1 hypothetical protein B0T26DRAFT_710879 [Lasiosphaeria miniovina]
MIENPFGDPWREETDRKIRIRLWVSFAVFEATIGEMRTAIDEMKRRIDGQRDGKVSELSRGVFTLRRSTYEDLLKTIRDNMSNLENLTDRNIELEPTRRVRSQGKLLKILRDMSDSFYRALRSSFNCSCEHDIGLSLERRSADITPLDDDDTVAKKIALQIAVSYKMYDVFKAPSTETNTTSKHMVRRLPAQHHRAQGPPPSANLPRPPPPHRRRLLQRAAATRHAVAPRDAHQPPHLLPQEARLTPIRPPDPDQPPARQRRASPTTAAISEHHPNRAQPDTTSPGLPANRTSTRHDARRAARGAEPVGSVGGVGAHGRLHCRADGAGPRAHGELELRGDRRALHGR